MRLLPLAEEEDEAEATETEEPGRTEELALPVRRLPVERVELADVPLKPGYLGRDVG